VTRFAAIDFETANFSRDSACAIGVVIVENGRVVDTMSDLIRPPARWFHFTDIHGITWEDVENAPTFDTVWKEIERQLPRVKFMAAHNAPFDQGVLAACCDLYNLPVPAQPFVCTVTLAPAQWGIYPTKLPNVCKELRISLKHHDAASDAEACARIVIAAQSKGWAFSP
jgi:DNA polymerase III subunit epsilon